MRSRYLGCLVAVLFLVSVRLDAAATLTAGEWRQDLDALVDHIKKNHRNPYHSTSATEFDEAYRELRQAIPDLAPRSIVLGMARLAAMIGDGHTRLTLPVDYGHLGLRFGHSVDPEPALGVPRFRTLPVRFRSFDGQLHVAGATREYTSWLGARVTAINGRDVDEALDAMEPWVYRDTPSGLRLMSARNLAMLELMIEAGLVDRDEAVVIELLRGDEAQSVELRPLVYGEQVVWKELGESEAPPLWLRDRQAYFWLESLSEEKVLYIQLNRVQDIPGGETLGQFGARVRSALAEHRPSKVVLDLRHNHGGDATLGRAMVLPLVRWEQAAEPGRLYALVGPETFSAAVLLLDRLEQWTQVVLVGEEPGSGPASYGDSDREILPHSKLVARVSTQFYKGWTGGEGRTRYEVDLPVAQTTDAVATGRDLVLAAAIDHEAGAGLAEQLIRAFDLGGINSSLLLGFRSRTDPLTAHRSTEAPMNALAAHVLNRGHARFAASLYLYNWENYPDSHQAYRGEARARLAMGDIDAARSALRKALELVPDDPVSLALSEQIERAAEE